MGQNPNSRRVAFDLGSCVAVGAAIGLFFGLVLLEGVVVGPFAGALVGISVVLIWHVQKNRERRD